jgi:hypothetical protein
VVYRRLKKLGYMPSRDNERSAVFEMLKRDIKLPRPKRGNERSTAREDQRVLKPGEIGGYFTRFGLVLEVVWTMPKWVKGLSVLPLRP